MTRKRLTRDEKKAETRAEVLAAAARLFSERGFHATAVEAITEEAGFSRGAFYSNFRRKEDLLVALLEDDIAHGDPALNLLAQQIDEIMARSRAESGPPGPHGRTWPSVEGPSKEWSLLFLEFWVCAARDVEIQSWLHETLGRVRSTLVEQLLGWFADLGVDAPAPVEEIAAAVFVMGAGSLFAMLADPDGVPDDILGHLLSNYWRGLGLPDVGPAET